MRVIFKYLGRASSLDGVRLLTQKTHVNPQVTRGELKGVLMAIQKILCCCGSGLGSSLMVEMQIQDVLNELGVSGVEVEHSTVSDVTPGAADLFIVARDLEDFIAGIPEDEKIVLSNILDKDEMKEKLTEKFGL